MRLGILRFRACGREICGCVRAVGNFAVPCVRSKILRLRACGSVFSFAVADAVEPQNRWPSLVGYIAFEFSVPICIRYTNRYLGSENPNAIYPTPYTVYLKRTAAYPTKVRLVADTVGVETGYDAVFNEF